MCNINDCTWGNRPDKATPEEVEKAEEFKRFRTAWVTIWAILNAGVGYTLTLFDTVGDDSVDSPGYYYIYFIGIAGVSILSIRFIGGFFYWFIETYSKTNKKSSHIIDENLIGGETEDRADAREHRPQIVEETKFERLEAREMSADASAIRALIVEENRFEGLEALEMSSDALLGHREEASCLGVPKTEGVSSN
jgi:hypothetical protein